MPVLAGSKLMASMALQRRAEVGQELLGPRACRQAKLERQPLGHLRGQNAGCFWSKLTAAREVFLDQATVLGGEAVQVS